MQRFLMQTGTGCLYMEKAPSLYFHNPQGDRQCYVLFCLSETGSLSRSSPSYLALTMQSRLLSSLQSFWLCVLRNAFPNKWHHLWLWHLVCNFRRALAKNPRSPGARVLTSGVHLFLIRFVCYCIRESSFVELCPGSLCVATYSSSSKHSLS